MTTLPENFLTTAEEAGRLDVALSKWIPDWSRARLQRLIENGSVTVDGMVRPSNFRLKSGMKVKITWPVHTPREIKQPPPENIPPIIYEDDTLLAFNKPAGVVVHPAAGHYDGNTLVELAEHRLGPGPWPDDVRKGLVHRLDRDTSGIILIAKTPQAQTQLSKQFADRKVKKTYRALVDGAVPQDEGKLEGNISRDPGARQKYTVSNSGRWALTKFKTIERYGKLASLMEFYPFTGRTHQIRVHAKAMGHPILGDVVYASPRRFKEILRQMLHAYAIQFDHPASGKRMILKAPVPNDFQEAIKLIRFNL